MWTPTKKDKYGVAMYNFDGTVRRGLPLQIGDTVQILETCAGWFRGFCVKNRHIKGIFPKAYIYLKECKVDVEGPEETLMPAEDLVVSEITYYLREWSTIWKKKYLMRQISVCDKVRNSMLDLISLRKQLVSGTLTREGAAQLKERSSVIVDQGNKLLGLDLVPRIDSEQVDTDKISTVALYHIHHDSMEKTRDLRTDNVQMRQRSIRTSDQAPIAPRVSAYHLYLKYHSFQCNVGEETEVQLAMFDAKTNQFYSEKFLVRLTKNGFPKQDDKIDDYSALFINLGSKDLSRDTYLVARILRVGSLREGESSKNTSACYRRPFGVGVLGIKDLLQSDAQSETIDTKEVELRIDLCSESDFATLHESMIRKQQSRSILSATQANTRIVVSLRLLCGELQAVRKAEPILLKSSAITRKMGFSDVIMPGDVRNDLYVTLVRGEFERGNKTAQRNVEVKATAIDAEGAIIKECYSCGSGEASKNEYLSYVYYHNNSPRWNETFKITIPTEINKCRGSHIRFEFRHCSSRDPGRASTIVFSKPIAGRDRIEKKLFSFGYMKLVTEDGTTICDGPHELFLYKSEDTRKLSDTQFYTSLPSCTSEINSAYGNPQGNAHFKRSEREMVIINTLLCSTKLTQNADLLGLLRWKDHPEKVDDNLEKLMNLDGEEIVKYLQDIMDALFNMFSFESRNRIPQSQLVFKALVYIFNILWDPKFEHFCPVMDAYISRHFSAVLVYKDLLICLKEMLDAVTAAITAPSLHEPFQRCFKVLEYTAKCIVQSRKLYCQAFSEGDKKEFSSLLQDVFANMAIVLSLESDVVIKTQSILLESLPKTFVQFANIHPKPDLSRALCMIINHMPRAMDATTLLYGVKLKCLKDIVNSAFFSCPDSKLILLPLCMGQLKRHLAHKQEMSLCATILGDILSSLHKDKMAGLSSHDNVQTVISSLLEIVIATMLDMAGERTKSKGLLVACVTDMLRQMEDDHYKKLLGSYKDKKSLKEFLNRLLQLFSTLIKRSAFHKDWMVMKMVMNSTVLRSVQYVAQTMCYSFLRGSDFDSVLWDSYFHLAVIFLTQPCLQLESFSQAKRQMFLQKYGDMRVQMGYEILSMWQNLGDHKLHFVPKMVSPILEVTLVPETELRKATLPIFFDMMQCEQQATGSFKQVETELLNHLDILVSSHKGDQEYKQLFNTVLLEKVQTEPSWQETGGSFVQSVTRLLERLLDYRNVLEGEENTEKRMTCTMNLLNFYKHEVDRQEMYIQYLYKLKDLHEQSGNHTEAAFTLLLHGELLDWTNQLLPEENNLPMEYAWKRKERLYLQVINLFDRGEAWEYGLPLCKELAQFYESKIQYDNLSKILTQQARFYGHILQMLRPDPEYFRVGFYGQSLPLFLRNREFVYRGNCLERLASFRERLRSEFSGVKLLTTTGLPNENIMQGQQQYIQICSVKPLPDISSKFLEPDVPEKVRSFYKVNDVDTFQLDRPYHVGHKNEKNEFKTLHIERVTMRIANTLPGILRWFKIDERQAVTLSPIQTAIDSMERKNNELRQLVSSYNDRQISDVRPLTMCLNGSIDAAVSGGFSKYQEAFFAPEFSELPENCEQVAKLRSLFLEQLHILEEGLELHNRLVSPDVRELHRRLVELYTTMKRGFQQSGSPTMSRLEMLLTTPVNEKRASQISTSSSVSYTSTPPGSNRSSGVYSECMDAPSMHHDSNGFLSEVGSSGSGTIVKKSGETRVSSDTGVHVRGSTPSLNSATSSVSLDSGIGHPGQGHKRSRTVSSVTPLQLHSSGHKDVPKPALPPRKASLTGMDTSLRDSSPLRVSSVGDRQSSSPSTRRMMIRSSTPGLQSTPRRNVDQLQNLTSSSPGRAALPLPLTPRPVAPVALVTGKEPPPIPPKRSISIPGADGASMMNAASPPPATPHNNGTQSATQTPTTGISPSIVSPDGTNRPAPPIPLRRGQGRVWPPNTTQSPS